MPRLPPVTSDTVLISSIVYTSGRQKRTGPGSGIR
jgi:hypothetical protein